MSLAPTGRASKTAALALLLALGLAATAAASDPVAVELEARARVQGGLVRLGDVARLGSASGTALAWLSLGRAPDAGKTRTIEASEVREAVAAAGFAPGAVSVRGAVRVQVECEGVALAGKTLADLARGFAASNLGEARGSEPGAGEPADVELELAAPFVPEVVSVPVGRESSALRPRWALAPSAQTSAATVAVEVVIDGETRATVEQGLRIRRFARALAPSRAFAKGEALDPHAFEAARVDRASLAPGALIDRADLTGASARHDLKAGAVVTRADVVLPLVVRKGERVAITIVKGALRVSSEAVALRDAARGETVPVQTRAGHEPLLGRATAEGRVEVGLETAPVASAPAPATPAAPAPAPAGGHP